MSASCGASRPPTITAFRRRRVAKPAAARIWSYSCALMNVVRVAGASDVPKSPPIASRRMSVGTCGSPRLAAWYAAPASKNSSILRTAAFASRAWSSSLRSGAGPNRPRPPPARPAGQFRTTPASSRTVICSLRPAFELDHARAARNHAAGGEHAGGQDSVRPRDGEERRVGIDRDGRADLGRDVAGFGEVPRRAHRPDLGEAELGDRADEAGVDVLALAVDRRSSRRGPRTSRLRR